MLKKAISLILSAAMLTSTLCITAAADTEISISASKYVPGYTLTVSGAASGSTYSWESRGADGTWTAIDGETSASYTIKNAQANKNIRAKVGDTYSNVVTIGSALAEPDYKTAINTTNPSEYLVTIADEESKKTTFSLLDAVDGEDGKEYFALLGYQVATASFNGDGPTAKFDPTNPENIGYWMNNSTDGMLAGQKMKRRFDYSSSTYTFHEDADKDGKPDQGESGTFNGLRSLKTVIDEYVVEHDWLTEAGHADTGVTDDYVFTAKYTLLSATEAIKYKDKFGYRLNTTYQRLRSPYKYSPLSETVTANSGKDINYLTAFTTTQSPTSSTSYIVSGTWCGNQGVRPCFYLNEDFFKDVKLDLTATGSKVKEIIGANYTKAELLAGDAGYTEAELDDATNGITFTTPTPADDYEMTLAHSLTTANSMSATYTVVNNTTAAASGKVILAVYDASGVCEKVYTEDVTISKGTKDYNINIEGLTATEGRKAKIFLWNNLTDLTPMCGAISF